MSNHLKTIGLAAAACFALAAPEIAPNLKKKDKVNFTQEQLEWMNIDYGHPDTALNADFVRHETVIDGIETHFISTKDDAGNLRVNISKYVCLAPYEGASVKFYPDEGIRVVDVRYVLPAGEKHPCAPGQQEQIDQRLDSTNDGLYTVLNKDDEAAFFNDDTNYGFNR